MLMMQCAYFKLLQTHSRESCHPTWYELCTFKACPLCSNDHRCPHEEVNSFTYLASCGNADLEWVAAFSRLERTIATCVTYGDWIRYPLSKGRVYNAAIHLVLLNGSETWPSRFKDIRCLEQFDQCCLHQLAKVVQSDRVKKQWITQACNKCEQ